MLQENQLFANRYRLVKRLGQGAFSEVWKAEDTKAGNIMVALKVYAPDKGLDEDGAKVFSDEFAIVFNVHHSNLLTPNYFDEENNSPYLVLPFCEQGSSLKLVGKMGERQAAQFLRDVSAALAYLHAKDIIHQDIKPDNVLIDGEGNFMVTDFGISTRIRSTLRRSVGDKKSAGTMAYMGPERFSNTPRAIKASDVWSLGATVYELMTGDVPFGDMGGGMQMAGALVPDIPGNYSTPLKQLVEQCLAKEPWDRPTAAQIRDICDHYLHTGAWDLSSLDKGETKKPESTNEFVGRKTVKRVKTPQNTNNIAQQENTTKTKFPQPRGTAEDKRSKVLMWLIGALMASIITLTILIFALDYGWNGIISLISLIVATFFVENFAFLLLVKQTKEKLLISIAVAILLIAQLVACRCICGHHIIDYNLAMMSVPVIISAIGVEAIIFAKQFGRVKWINTVLAVSMLIGTAFVRFVVIYNMGYYGMIRIGISEIIIFIITVLAVCVLSTLLFRYIKRNQQAEGAEMKFFATPKKQFTWIIGGVVTTVAVMVLVLVIYKPTPVSIESMDNGDIKITVNGVPYLMKYVEGGTFQMGSEDYDPDFDDNPLHPVTVNSFYLGEAEVTQELWKAVMGCTLYYQEGKNDQPMENVSWNDCQSFIQRLNRLTGQNFHLPTEAEWEYAARGGKHQCNYKYAGSDSLDMVAWYDMEPIEEWGNTWEKSYAQPVKTKLPNSLGIYDMSGNLCEWCEDLYGDYDISTSTTPIGKFLCGSRVIRGGSWQFGENYCQVSKRWAEDAEERFNYFGFRLALAHK